MTRETHNAFKFESQSQRIVHSRLRNLLGQIPSDMYLDALRLLQRDDSLMSRSNIIGHLAREIESALLGVITPDVNLPDGFESIRDELDASVIEAVVRKEIPEDIAKIWIEAWQRRSDSTRKQRIFLFVNGLDMDDERKANLTADWGDLRLHSIAHRTGLTARPAALSELAISWEQFDRILFVVLEGFEISFRTAIDRVDRVLDEPSPSTNSFRAFNTSIPNTNAIFRYFFEGLLERDDAAELLPRLKKANLFSSPPPPLIDPETGILRGIRWEHSEYLSRIAPIKPREVLDTICSVPESDNHAVHDGLARASNNLDLSSISTEEADRLVDVCASWLDSEHGEGILRTISALPHHLIDLAKNLGTHGHFEASVRLYSSILTIEQDNALGVSNVRARIDDHAYREVIQAVIRSLESTEDVGFWDLIHATTNQAISIYRSTTEMDLVYMARAKIGDEDESFEPVLNQLITGSSRAAALVFQRFGKSKVIDQLLESDQLTFRRIALHILSTSELVDESLCMRAIFNKDLASEYAATNEFLALVRNRLPDFGADAIDRYVEFIDSGPTEVGTSHEDDPVRSAELVKSWKYVRMAQIEHLLPKSHQEEFDQLKEMSEPVEDLVPQKRVTAWWGERNKFDSHALGKMTDDELVEFILGWEPNDGPLEPTHSGQADELKKSVIADPSRFSKITRRLTESKDEYLSAMVNGLLEAFESSDGIDPDDLLSLAEAVSNKISVLPIVDVGWNLKWAARKSLDIAAKIAESTNTDNENHERIFERVKHLTIAMLGVDDPPSTSFEVDGDPLHHSINSVRGTAIEVLVLTTLAYAKSFGAPEKRSWGNFESFGISDALDKLVDPVQTSSPTIRATIGRWFPILLVLDREWVISRMSQIFPVENPVVRSATFYGFVATARPNFQTWELLEDEYHNAVIRLNSLEPLDWERESNQSQRRIANHLIAIYFSGNLELESETLILCFDGLSDELRGQLIGGIADGISVSEGPTLSRYVDFWDWRLDVVKNDPHGEHGQEMLAFSEWFEPEKLGIENALTRVIQSLSCVAAVSSTYHLSQLLERVAPLAESEPLSSLRIVESAVRLDEDGWLIASSRDVIVEIFDSAISSGDQDAARAISRLANRLIAKGATDEFLRFTK